jgi:hypothetical protein
MDHEFHMYKYVDDTDDCWMIKVSDYLAQASGLELIPPSQRKDFPPMSRSFKPRHLKLVALDERPGMQKYRVDLIINERHYDKFWEQIFIINGMRMRCARYVGEQRTAY